MYAVSSFEFRVSSLETRNSKLIRAFARRLAPLLVVRALSQEYLRHVDELTFDISDHRSDMAFRQADEIPGGWFERRDQMFTIGAQIEGAGDDVRHMHHGIFKRCP
jgi:hypothetical protein